MKKFLIGLPMGLIFLGVTDSCQSPFFGETLNAEHVEEEVYVPPQYDKVVPPLTVSATQNGVDKIDLTWSKVVSASGYRIYRSEESETGFELLSEVSETVFSDNGSIFPLKSGVSYYYKISSVNLENVESSLTAAVVGRCYLQNGEVVPPSVVTASQGSYSDRIVVSWDSVPTAAEYRVLRFETEAEGVSMLEISESNVCIETDQTRFEDTSQTLTPGKNYYYRVQSVGAVTDPGDEPVSSVLSVAAGGYLADPTVPAVQGLHASTTDPEQVLLTWEAVNCPVRIFRAEDDAEGNYVVLTDVASGTEYADTKSSGNLKEKKYFYKIQAVKSETEKGVLSAAVEGHVPIEPPVITLKDGDIVIDINRTRTFVDPGYEATDNFDGDLTSYCLVDESAIAFTKRGEWFVTYSVTDAAGQTTTVERKVKTVFLPNIDNADIVTTSRYAVDKSLFTVEVQGIQPPEVPEGLDTSYSYEWSVPNGEVTGYGSSCTVLVKMGNTVVQETDVSVKISTLDGFETLTKKILIYPDLSGVCTDFSNNGKWNPYTADYRLVWKKYKNTWTLEEKTGLTANTIYSYLPEGTIGHLTENIISVSGGEFIMHDTSVYKEFWDHGDAAETAVRLRSPEFGIAAGVEYQISVRIYRAEGSKADVFVRVGNENVCKDFETVKSAGWQTYTFDYTPDADNTVSLQVWKMPVGVRVWSDVTDGDSGNLRTGSDQKEVRIDDLSVTYKN